MNRPSASPPSLTDSSTPARNIPPRARRGPRARIACVRCQRRKIRCDGAVPSCGSCLKVGAECVDGGRQNGIETPRALVTILYTTHSCIYIPIYSTFLRHQYVLTLVLSYILSLKARVAWLEGLIRTNCPHIDLEQGPQIPHDSSLEVRA